MDMYHEEITSAAEDELTLAIDRHEVIGFDCLATHA
jgi:hypothetical protein